MYIMSNDIVILAYLIRWNYSIGIYSLTVIRFLKKKNNGKLLNYKSTWYATCWIKQLIKIMSQTSAISKAAFDILICRHCYFTVYYSLFYFIDYNKWLKNHEGVLYLQHLHYWTKEKLSVNQTQISQILSKTYPSL